ncbi:glycosyl transferase [Geotalea uraniireducens]|uniref:Glycosyl transferase n=1 Tax=Geotalea uraniireducens TaxID=351604 RepID=A0ABM8EIJ0_9BACT|nr:TIGR04283 family arsenosugar biosynthesis glycosyltransferase [Geotalea uraniireducens]BDV42256.1 glycosyl transferase [Geotalea uraniireducens]
MPGRDSTPELSIIVPTLNEATIIGDLCASLAAQRDCAFELIVADGGSTDDTRARLAALATTVPYPLIVVDSPAGRGRQMNAGVGAASGATLLFLHADCLLPAPAALRNALAALAAATAARGDDRLAGRFRLRFARPAATPNLPYYFYEWKARLPRPECIRGDQGLLLGRRFFAELGRFDPSLPFLEDVRLVARIAAAGGWLLLPDEIVTSARRFATEGLRERQTLNAIVADFAALGWLPFMGELPGLYRSHDRSGRLDLAEALERVAGLVRDLPLRSRLRLWYETGCFVRGNAWQLAFFADIRRHHRRGVPLEGAPLPRLARHDRTFDRLTDHPVGHLAAALLTWGWFRLTLARERRRPRRAG